MSRRLLALAVVISGFGLGLPGSAHAAGPAFEHAFGARFLNACTSSCQPVQAGGGAGQLSYPSGAAAVSGGEVFISDSSNQRVDVFDATSGAFKRAFGKNVDPNRAADNRDVCTSSCRAGSRGGTAGQLSNPSGVAVSGGEVFVSDYGNQRVDVFDALSGEFKRAFGKNVNPDPNAADPDVCTTSCQAGQAGGAAGQLNTPTGVAISGGEVFISDQGNGRVDVFDATSGAFERAFGKNVNIEPATANPDVCTSSCRAGSGGDESGRLNSPTGVAVGGGEVFVADPGNQRVAVFDATSGAFKRAFGKNVNPDGNAADPDVCTTSCQIGEGGGGAGQLNNPNGVAVSGGEVFVSDWQNERVSVFDATSGEFKRAFGKNVNPDGNAADPDVCTTSCQTGQTGSDAGQLNNPTGVAVSGGEVFVSDRLNQRVDVFDAATGAFKRALAKGVDTDNFDCTAASGCASGDAGGAAGQFNTPSGLAVSGSEVFVSDSNNWRIDVFDASSGAFKRAFGKHVNPDAAADHPDVCTTSCQAGQIGSGAAGELFYPTAVAVSGGELFVADQGNQRVDVFDATSGAFKRAFGKNVNPDAAADHPDVCTTSCQAGQGGGAAGQLVSPNGVAVSGGELFVSAQGNQRVDVFDATSGAFKRAFGKHVNSDGAADHPDVCTTSCQTGAQGGESGELNSPTGLAVSGGEVFVSDWQNERVSVFDATSGAFKRAFGKNVNSDGAAANPDVCTTSCQTGQGGDAAGQLSYASGVAVSGGEVFVSDFFNARVTVFDATTGTFARAFGKNVNADPAATNPDVCTSSCRGGQGGGEAGKLWGPYGVAASGGEVLVSDQENERVSVFGDRAVTPPDATPPVLDVSTVPAGPPSGQAGFFNAQDLAVNGGHILVKVTADDPSGVAGIACTDDGHPVAVGSQSGARPRTGSVALSGDGTHHVACLATDKATPPNTGAAAGSHPAVTVRIDTRAPGASVKSLPRFSRTHSSHVEWSGSDAESGVGTFDVRRREAPGRGRFAAFRSKTTAREGRFSARSGTTECFSVRARDKAGNLSPYSVEQCTAFPLDDRALTPSVGWQRRHGAGASGSYGGTLSRSRAPGATLTSPRARGSQFALLVTTGPRAGKLKVLWQGHTRTITIPASSRVRNRQLITLHGVSGRGQMKLTVQAGVVAIDGLGIYQHP